MRAATRSSVPYTGGEAYDIDNIAPQAPAVTAISNDRVVADGITNDTTLIITGTAEAGSTVEVRRDGSIIGTTTCDGTGHWQLDDTATTLTDGTTTLTAFATDARSASSPASRRSCPTRTPAAGARAVHRAVRVCGSRSLPSGQASRDRNASTSKDKS